MRVLMRLAFALGACALHPSNAATVPGTLTIVGSDTLSTLVLRWIDAFRAQHPEALIQMQTPGSASAPIALLEGAADIGPMSRPMNDAELKAFRDRYGYAPTSIVVAREKAGRDMVVGKSTHSLVQARAAAHEGADYIGFGPLYATPTKPDYQPIGLGDIAQVHADVTVPIFCIGGIKLENLPDVLAAGARRVVIVSGLLQASDIVKYAREAKRALARIKPQTSPLKHS